MFMNLHSLPAGQHMYTFYLANPAEFYDGSSDVEEEFDLVAPAYKWTRELIKLLKADPEFADLYDITPTFDVVAIADQSSGEVVYDLRTTLLNDITGK